MRILSLLVLIFTLCLSGYESHAQDNTSPLETYYSSLEWRNIGPFRGGRSCAVTGVPGKPNLFYFGATGGGVWRTTDGGRSWSNLSDGYFGGSIGAIAVAPSDHNVIYVGGGEKTVRGNVSYGYGVWKSVDGGKTWSSMGLTDSRHISRIRIHPTNPDIVYAAVMGNLFAPNEERGLYKSTDGGNSWHKSLYINDEVGIVDHCLDPSNPRIMYASSWRVNRTPYSLNSGGPGSGIWKSTDSGVSWTELTTNKGLPTGVWGISGIAVSHIDGDRIYALIENEDGGVYRSDDGGQSWQKTNDHRALRQRAWYYTRIYTDTHDHDKLYVVNVSYHTSTDAGKTFSASNAPHGDHHDLWIAPEDPKRMIIADDGGAQVTYDGGETWSTYHNQPTAQFYRVTTDNAFPYRILAAQQDNSAIRIRHRTKGSAITEDDWESTAGSESAHLAADPLHPDIVYGGSYGGFLSRVDHQLNTTRAINVYPDNPMGYGAEGMKYRFQWNFPIFFSHHNPKALYAASNHLHRTTNEGQTWEIISPDLTRNDPDKLRSSGGPITQDNTGVEYYCTIFAAAESPVQEGIIWAGSDDGLIHVTRNGGADWINVTPTDMPEWLMINCIDPDPQDAATCYIAGTLYKTGDFQPYLYKTIDYGKSWKKITNGIPNDHFTRAIRADKSIDGLLYAGTESGMYISYNDGQLWHPFQLNLPIVPITDLTIKDNNLIASTQGRGLWIIDDITVIHQALKMDHNKTDFLFKPVDSYRFDSQQNKKNTQAGLNHPGGVTFHYYLHNWDAKDSLSFTIYDSSDLPIQKYSNHAKEKERKIIDVQQGSQTWNWNMKYEDAKKFEGMILWWGSMSGPTAVPGHYKVVMQHNEMSLSQDFVINGDPSLPILQDDYQAQFDFIQSINSKVTEAHEAIIEIRDIKSALHKYKDIVSHNETILSEIQNIDSTLNIIENELYQTKNQSRQDPLNYPIKLTNKLAHLNSLTQVGDFPPTDAAIEVRDVITQQIDDQLEAYLRIRNQKIPALNAAIRNAEIDYIILKDKK